MKQQIVIISELFMQHSIVNSKWSLKKRSLCIFLKILSVYEIGSQEQDVWGMRGTSIAMKWSPRMTAAFTVFRSCKPFHRIGHGLIHFTRHFSPAASPEENEDAADK